MRPRGRALLAAAASLTLVVTLTAAAWAVAGAGSAATVTAAHLDAGVPSTGPIQGGVTLTWPPGTPPPDQWQIVRATSSGGPWSVIATLPGSATTYTDLTAGGPYYYEVRPVLASWTGDLLPTGAPAPTGVTPLPAIPLPLSDTFTKNGTVTALASTEVGAQPWLALNSALATWTRNGTAAASSYAATTTATSSNPMLVVDAGTADVAATVRVASVGDAIYLRVSDATTWLRLRLNETAFTTTTYRPYRFRYWAKSGTVSTCTAQVYAATTTDFSTAQAELAALPDAGLNGCPTDMDVNEGADSGLGATSATTYSYQLVLELSASGAITGLGSWAVGGSAPGYMGLTASGSSLVVRDGPTSAVATTVGTVTSSFNQGATKHGVGFATSSYGTSTGVGAMTLAAP